MVSAEPTMILYGGGGVGKTWQLLSAFPDYFWVVSDNEAMNGLKSHIAQDPEGAKAAGLRLPERSVYLPSRKPGGREVTDTIGDLERIMDKFAAAFVAGTSKSRGIVLCEASSFFKRADAQLTPRYPDARQRSGPLKLFCELACEVAKSSGFGLVLEMQARSADYWANDDKTVPADLQGTLKWEGGPAFPYGKSVRDATREFDFVWQICAEGSERKGVTGRYVLTSPGSGEWFRKSRDVRVSHREDLQGRHIGDILAGLREK